jgi:hypothetical protein
MRNVVSNIDYASSHNVESSSIEYSVVDMKLWLSISRIFSYGGYYIWRDERNPSFWNKELTRRILWNINISHTRKTTVIGINRRILYAHFDPDRGFSTGIYESDEKIQCTVLFWIFNKLSTGGGEPSSLGQFQRSYCFYNSPDAYNYQEDRGYSCPNIAFREIIGHLATGALFVIGFGLIIFALVSHTIFPPFIRWPICLVALIFSLWAILRRLKES